MQGQETKIRLAIFGVGMHFQETYTTALKREEIYQIVDLVWVADLAEKEQLVKKRCNEAGQKPEFIGVSSFTDEKLPNRIAADLDKMLKTHPVDAVLVSTTPEQHRAYASWALQHKLPVLLDKPITSRQNAAFDEVAALGIAKDWQVLDELSNTTGTMLMVNSHRRFHPAYYKVGKILEEVSSEYGFGVTAISSFNSDGQWRLPNELLDIEYHGFNTGNGVLSHFGYHYLDLAATWYRKGTVADRLADSAKVSSSFLSAADYARQISPRDIKQILKSACDSAPKPDYEGLQELLARFGEVDAFGSIEMYKAGVMTAHINLQMLHSGFSQRAWTNPAENLYKENGRLRWENHLIQQGPLHAIEIRSFQAVQPSHWDPEEGLPRWGLGGTDQLEINVFRNKLIGGKPLDTINVKDLIDEVPENDVMHEDIKAKVLQLFVGLIAKENGLLSKLKAKDSWKKYVNRMSESGPQDLSLIGSHQPTTAFMAGMYASNARRINKPNMSERVEVELIW